MGKMRVFAVLSIVAGLLSVGAIFWQRDSGPSATSELSSGEGKASVDARREVSKDPSYGLMSRNLIEPAPGFQATRPEWREQSVATSMPEAALDEERTSAELALPPRADETSPDSVPDAPFGDGASTDEVLAEQPADAIGADSKVDLAPPPVATPEPDTTEGNVIVGTDDAAVGEWLEMEDAVSAPATEGIDAVAEPSPSPPLRQASEPAGSRISVPESVERGPESVERGNEHEQSRLLASKPAQLDHGITPTEDLKTSEPPSQSQGADANNPSFPPVNSVIYVKRLLRLLGHVPGSVDGRTDPKTTEAILAFQKDNGRETTGQIDDELIAAMERMLFESFRQYRETEPGTDSETPNVTQAEQSTEKAADIPTTEAAPPAPPSEIANLGTQAKQPAMEGAVQEAALPEPSSRLEASSEKAVEKAKEDVVNAFEACATSAQRDYVKTETGFVLCEGLSFDTRSRQ